MAKKEPPTENEDKGHFYLLKNLSQWSLINLSRSLNGSINIV